MHFLIEPRPARIGLELRFWKLEKRKEGKKGDWRIWRRESLCHLTGKRRGIAKIGSPASHFPSRRRPATLPLNQIGLRLKIRVRSVPSAWYKEKFFPFFGYHGCCLVITRVLQIPLCLLEMSSPSHLSTRAGPGVELQAACHISALAIIPSTIRQRCEAISCTIPRQEGENISIARG